MFPEPLCPGASHPDRGLISTGKEGGAGEAGEQADCALVSVGRRQGFFLDGS